MDEADVSLASLERTEEGFVMLVLIAVSCVLKTGNLLQRNTEIKVMSSFFMQKD